MEEELVPTRKDKRADDDRAENDKAQDDGAEGNGAQDDGAEDDGAEDDRTQDDGAQDAMVELLCPICWQLLHRPHSLQPCEHSFCEPCLRRLARFRIHTCPICRSLITECHLDEELHDSIETQYQDVYIQRQQDEMASGIFNEPLPPVRRTLQEGLYLLPVSMVLLMFGIIVIFLIPMVLLMVPIQYLQYGIRIYYYTRGVFRILILWVLGDNTIFI